VSNIILKPNLWLTTFAAKILALIFLSIPFAYAECFKAADVDGIAYNFPECLKPQELAKLLEDKQAKLDLEGYAYSKINLKEKQNDKLIFEVENLPFELIGNNGFLFSSIKTFNAFKVDEALENAGRLKTVETKGVIKENDNKLQLALVSKRLKPVNVNYNFSNESYDHGAKHTFSVDLEHYLGYYEALNLSFNKTKGGKLFATNFSVPAQTFMLKARYSHSTNKTSRIGRDNLLLNTDENLQSEIYRYNDELFLKKPDILDRSIYSTINNWQYQNNKGIGFDKTLFRDKAQVLKFGFDLERRKPSRFQNNLRLESLPLTVAKFDIIHSLNREKYDNSLTFSISKGLKLGGVANDKLQSGYKYNPRAQFIKYNLDNIYTTTFLGRGYSVSTSIQKAYHNLYDEEKMALASFGNVRGYYYESANAENGILVKQDYTISTHKYNGFAARPYVFLDAGAGKRSKSSNHYYLSSFGIGAAVSKDRAVLNATFAVPFRNNLKRTYEESKRSKPSLFINFRFNLI